MVRLLRVSAAACSYCGAQAVLCGWRAVTIDGSQYATLDIPLCGTGCRGGMPLERGRLPLGVSRRERLPCVVHAGLRSRGLHASVRQLCRYDRDLHERQGKQQDRESNVTHGLILSGLVLLGATSCSLEHNAPIAGYNNLQPTGQQPMSTGGDGGQRGRQQASTGERRISTGGFGGKHRAMRVRVPRRPRAPWHLRRATCPGYPALRRAASHISLRWSGRSSYCSVSHGCARRPSTTS